MSSISNDHIGHLPLPDTMLAMVLEGTGRPLRPARLPVPVPGPGQVLVKVLACGVCRTDLHVVDGELPHPKLPLVPGHEIVGIVARAGDGITKLQTGDIVGIPWLAYTCGACRYCLRGQENLCENAIFTGYTIDGGYAQYTLAYEQYCFPMDAQYAGPQGAPLLCAGLIGYRSFRMTGPSLQRLGIYGFGAAAHLLIQVARHQGVEVYAFTREGDQASQYFALRLGAEWAGSASARPPVMLDAAIIFAPAGELVPAALQATDKGGIVVCGGIHMSDIPSFPYRYLWEERIIRSVANLTRKDGEAFLRLAPTIPIKTETQHFPLSQANEALDALRNGRIKGAAVLVMDDL